MNTAGGNLLCFGMGYTARALAASLGGGWTVAGTYREDEDKPSSRRGLDIDLVPFGGAETVLAAASHILVSVPPGEAGDPVLGHYQAQLAGRDDLNWIGYLSSTGVYGDSGGASLDETAPLKPTNARGRWRLEAETAWRNLADAHRLPLHIFRLAGIYGPGRSALGQVRAGRARRIGRPGFKFSRIHVEDVVAVLKASMAAPDPLAVYNVCDDEPAEQEKVVAHACGLLGAEVPPLIPFEQAEAGMSPMARSFWSDHRLVDNSRIKRDLGIILGHPDYRSGLEAILAAEK